MDILITYLSYKAKEKMMEHVLFMCPRDVWVVTSFTTPPPYGCFYGETYPDIPQVVEMEYGDRGH